MRTGLAIGLLLAVWLTAGCGGEGPTTPLPTARSKIAFTDKDAHDGLVYVVSADGTKRRVLKRPDTTIDALAWRSDGRAIAWMETRRYHTTSDIWIMNADGSGQRAVIASLGGLTESLSWSPDGRQLALGCVGGFGVCIVNVDGSEYHRLRPTLVKLVIPGEELDRVYLSGGDWSPTGHAMAFDVLGPGPNHIYIGKPDGSRLRRITSGTGDDFSPAWSPDGKRIVFARSLNGGDERLYVVNADGAGLRKLELPIDGHLGNPDWSPDGKHIVFDRLWGPGCGLHCSSDIYVVNVDGSHLRELTHKDHAHRPAWSRELGDHR